MHPLKTRLKSNHDRQEVLVGGRATVAALARPRFCSVSNPPYGPWSIFTCLPLTRPHCPLLRPPVLMHAVPHIYAD
jgi:hypothetical protein